MATETRLPDAIKSSSNVSNATVAAISAEDGNYVTTVSGTVNTICRVSFQDASANITGTQTFTAKVRKSGAAGTNPTARIEVYDGTSATVLVQTANISVPSEVTNTTITLTLDASLFTDPTGAAVEARLVGVRSATTSSGRSVDFDSLIWTANTVAGGAASIAPDNAVHGHAATSPTIASKASITPANAAHAHTATSPTVAAKSILSPANATHGHTATQPNLGASGPTVSIAPGNSVHAHTATQPAIAAKASVSPASSLHGHSATSLAIGARSPLTAADATHGHVADSPSITANAPLFAEIVVGGSVLIIATSSARIVVPLPPKRFVFRRDGESASAGSRSYSSGGGRSYSSARGR